MQSNATRSQRQIASRLIVKKGLRHILSKLIILVVAIQILDVSIDIDHLTAGSACVNVAGYDDTDSFSELLIESIAGNDHYLAETGTDDHSPFQKRAHKLHNFVFFSKQKAGYTLYPLFKYPTRQKEISFNTSLQQEDFSFIFSPPPEPAERVTQLS